MIFFYRRPDGSIRDYMTPEAAAISLMEVAIEVLREGKGELYIQRVNKFGGVPPLMSDEKEDWYDDYAVLSLDEED